jgi:hypothetical protein
LIEPQRDPVQVRLREAREICSPREILSQRAVDVLEAIQWAGCRDKNACRIAASSRLFALNREISVCAGLRGGGRSRTSLCHIFPVLTGKNTGNFTRIRPLQHGSSLESADNSATFDEIPCRSQQGILERKQGRIIFRTGNLLLIPAASSGPPLPCHLEQSLGIMLRSDCGMTSGKDQR